MKKFFGFILKLCTVAAAGYGAYYLVNKVKAENGVGEDDFDAEFDDMSESRPAPKNRSYVSINVDPELKQKVSKEVQDVVSKVEKKVEEVKNIIGNNDNAQENVPEDREQDEY
ncbi:MAG: hypothetical protein K6B75_00895 [Lachnospiraceae bacterium]|nr:hypothetical protein [Lachnospiraceae bacterium]